MPLSHRLAFGFPVGVLAGALLVCLGVSPAQAGTITFDLNGFPNAAGGQISGQGLEAPLRLAPGEATVQLEGLQPGGRYTVDFFHASGKAGGDFGFTMNESGDGVASVALGGETHVMVVDFKPGDDTLKLNTHEIVINADGAQGSAYFVSGLWRAHGLDAKAYGQPRTETVIPGAYRWDNLSNPGGGKEDFTFIVDDQGRITPAEGYEAYIVVNENRLTVRTAIVRFEVHSHTDLARLHTTNTPHYRPRPERLADGSGWRQVVEIPLGVGPGGVNVWSFGPVTSVRGDALDGTGEPYEGQTRKNDFVFAPMITWSQKEGFSFQTADGPSRTVMVEARGMFDDGSTPLTVTVKATILKPGEETKLEDGNAG